MKLDQKPAAVVAALVAGEAAALAVAVVVVVMAVAVVGEEEAAIAVAVAAAVADTKDIANVKDAGSSLRLFFFVAT
jgi:hypothetical protein